jgi:hypothetical protein
LKQLDLIDRNVLLEKAYRTHPATMANPYGGEYVVSEEDIENAPSIDAAPVVHGHWINTPPYRASNGNYNKAQECSVCHAYFVSSGNTPYSNHKYCCECGAKMDGEIVYYDKR